MRPRSPLTVAGLTAARRGRHEGSSAGRDEGVDGHAAADFRAGCLSIVGMAMTHTCQACGCDREATTGWIDTMHLMPAGHHRQVLSCRPHLERWADGEDVGYLLD